MKCSHIEERADTQLTVRLLLDAMPLVSDLSYSSDYAAQKVFSAVGRPLSRYDPESRSVVGYAAFHSHCSNNATVHRFELEKRLRWSDGSPIDASHFEYAIKHALANKTPASIRLPRIKRICTWKRHPHRIDVELLQPDFHLFRKLAHPAFSPRRYDAAESASAAGRVASGDYSISRLTGQQFSLSPNSYLVKSKPDLSLQACSSPIRALARYETGLVDFTCGTTFPLWKLSEYRTRDDFVVRPSPLIIALLPVSHTALDEDLRIAISCGVDRSEIANVLYNGVEPASTFLPHESSTLAPMSYRTSSTVAQELANGVFNRSDKARHIRIGYDRFYPNYQVTRIIKQQLNRLGFKCQVTKDDFARPGAQPCDFRLAVLVSSYAYELSLYRKIGVCTPIVFEPSKLQRYWDLIHQYDAACEMKDLQRCRAALEETVWNSAYAIPIVRMLSCSLQRPIMRNLLDIEGLELW